MSQVSVRIPTPLRPLAGGAAEVEVPGATVAEVLADLGHRFPGFTERILDARGGIRAFVNIYVGDRNIRQLDGLDSALDAGDVLHIVPAVAGGQR